MNGPIRSLFTGAPFRGVLIVFSACIICLSVRSPAAGAALEPPVLLWDRGGCTSWCMTGWYASPAVADLDANGTQEVIWASYKLWVLDATTGNEYWSVYAGHDIHYSGSDSIGRTWSSPVVADIDRDGRLDIITAHSGGWVCAYSITGEFMPGWPVQASPSSELRTLAAYDFEKDGYLEIVVASTSSGDDEEWYVYDYRGRIRPGWPQHSGDCYAAGCFNQNVAVADIDHDDLAEVIGPNDTHYICAFSDAGACIPAHPMYNGRFWGQVGVWVDLEAEIRGWGNCGVEHRPNFCHSPPVVADMDGDGTLELLFVGNVHNCDTSPYTDLYEVPILLNPDRSRYHQGAFDWTIWPAPPAPGAWEALSQDYNIIESCYPNPTVADIDGDGFREIFYPAYDGRVHGFRLDKTEFGEWPYSVTHPAEGFIRFASEVLAADLDGDGTVEIIFGSWTEKSSGQTGRLHILTGYGQVLFTTELPHDPGEWNGILGAPTLADIDGNGDLELVAGTSSTGVVAYDLPGASGSDIQWGTGRGGYLRNGAIETELPDIGIDISTDKPAYTAGDTMHVSLALTNPRPDVNCDMYLAILIYGIPLFLSPEPAWPSFSADPYRFPLRPLPGGFELPATEILALPFGNDPLPEISFDWYAILTSADSLHLLALDSESVSLV